MVEMRTNEWVCLFFRYHYTKGADAAVTGTETAASLLTTPRGATRSEKTLRFQTSLQAEWKQNNLPFIGDIRGHSNPGNRFFSFFLYLFSPFLPSFLPSLLSSTDSFRRRSVFRRAIIFAAWRPLTRIRRQCTVSIQRKRKTCQLEVHSCRELSATVETRETLSNEKRHNDQFS